MFYVCIDGVSRAHLEFCGYRVVYENAEFEIIECYNGDEQILPKAGKRLLAVEDINEAQAVTQPLEETFMMQPPSDAEVKKLPRTS